MQLYVPSKTIILLRAVHNHIYIINKYIHCRQRHYTNSQQ